MRMVASYAVGFEVVVFRVEALWVIDGFLRLIGGEKETDEKIWGLGLLY